MIDKLIFPAFIRIIEVDRNIILRTQNLISQFLQSEKWNSLEHLVGQTLTTYYSDSKQNFLGDIGAYDLLGEINLNTCGYLRKLGMSPDKGFNITSWLNVNPFGTGHVIHEHYGALISGTVYIKVPKNSGNIVFYDNNKTRVQNNLFHRKYQDIITEYNKEFISIEPVEATMILFESWVSHSVDQNITNENRISVSFNIGT
jgi:uncharacterized protein (TIGR02466 family)